VPEQQKARAKGRKIGRNRKHQATIYRATDRANKNRKRRMRRHLRNHPSDEQGAALYEREYGGIAHIGVTARASRREYRKLHPRKRRRSPGEIAEAIAQRIEDASSRAAS
jgi:hypothetical protein